MRSSQTVPFEFVIPVVMTPDIRGYGSEHFEPITRNRLAFTVPLRGFDFSTDSHRHAMTYKRLIAMVVTPLLTVFCTIDVSHAGSVSGSAFTVLERFLPTILDKKIFDTATHAFSYACLDASEQPFDRNRYAYENRCQDLDENDGCYFYDYRNMSIPDGGVDQRGIEAYQLTFPQETDRWAAVAINNPANSRFCWSGGALIGRNPLAMSWGGGDGADGSKNRPNNFLRSESGTLWVEGARVHNVHDALLATSNQAGYDINDSWMSWIRDDLFEGYLHKLSIRNSLIDGVYSFLSDPDGSCTNDKNASDRTVVIENSLIRVQNQPGPYGRFSDKWHWKVDGGHGSLWKLDSCSWQEWPKFILRNNVFLIEGPGTNASTFKRAGCNLALPGDCNSPALTQLDDCSNNLFLYKDYHYWLDAEIAPGPTPEGQDRFYNPQNPAYLLNGEDCYQRVTDDPRDAGYGDVNALWTSARQNWIDLHTDTDNSENSIMQIAGVDYPGVAAGSSVQLVNRASGFCIDSSGDGNVALQPCTASTSQLFTVEAFQDGKLSGAVLLKDHAGGYLRTQDQTIIEQDNSDNRLVTTVFQEIPTTQTPGFSERWYLLPRDNEPGVTESAFVIESDALRRSFLRGDSELLSVQRHFGQRESTPLPQVSFVSGDDHAMHWQIVNRDSGSGQCLVRPQ